MTEQNKNKEKRRFGDRRDAKWVRDINGLNTIMAYLMPKRTEAEVYLNETIDATELLKFIAEKNKNRGDRKITLFHCMVYGMAKMILERPYMNRFIQGYRTYQRNKVSLAFVCKRRYTDEAEEALMIFEPKDEYTIDEVADKIIGDVIETRKSEHSTGGIDKTVNAFAKIPRPLLAIILRIIRILDFWGKNPKALTEGDPNYATAFMSNLGSIKCPAVYHHINNYGTNSMMVTIGVLHKEELIMPDGSKEIRDVFDIGATIDERIADGFYFARSLRLIKYIMANPSLLDKPFSENSGFNYEASDPKYTEYKL